MKIRDDERRLTSLMSMIEGVFQEFGGLDDQDVMDVLVIMLIGHAKGASTTKKRFLENCNAAFDHVHVVIGEQPQ